MSHLSEEPTQSSFLGILAWIFTVTVVAGDDFGNLALGEVLNGLVEGFVIGLLLAGHHAHRRDEGKDGEKDIGALHHGGHLQPSASTAVMFNNKSVEPFRFHESEVLEDL
jgi:hypothetical protein